MEHKKNSHLAGLARTCIGLFYLLLVFGLSLPAMAVMKELPRSFSIGQKSLAGVDTKAMIDVNVAALLAEDAARGRAERPGPIRFAQAIDVELNLTNSGTWLDLSDGSRIWRLRIQSDGAKSINLGFTVYELPDGAKLWIYDPIGDHVEGPFTSENRTRAGELWTPIILGPEVVVELFVPADPASEPVLEIGKVNHGYRFFGGIGDKAGNCNIDVVCPAGNAWGDQIRSVAVYTLNGMWTCTGQLLNNTNQDFTPYFLTANHCGINGINDATMVFYWNYESPVCMAHGGGSLADNQAGATLRANWATSDFALVELDAAPDPEFNVYYDGWDATGGIPPSTVCIHHPSCDEKSISFDNDAANITDYDDDTIDPSSNHWRVVWDTGTTEHGSSGSCLYDTSNGLCIGQLHGGDASCAFLDGPDWFGKLSVSWNGGGAANNRLRNWLDPANTGVLTLAGAEPPIAGGPSMRVVDTDLDYGDVELGFAATQAVVVYNDGDAMLTVTVSNQSVGDPDIPQWSELNEVANFDINPGDAPLIVQQVYEPQAIGDHSITFRVTGNDLDNPQQDVTLRGSGVNPVPIDSVLVMDRSGSMGENAGERRKIDAMRDASALYADLLRPDIGDTGTGDKIGFVKYNHTNQVYLGLDFVDDPDVAGSHMADAMDKLSDAALEDAGRLKPTGMTGISDAIETAAGLYTLPAGDRKHVMVVLTDGIETVQDELDVAAIVQVRNNNPDLWMYSVGVGMNVNPASLQNITNIANGYHQISDDLSGESIYDLELFYFKIFANATGMDLAVDPTVAVGLDINEPTTVATAHIISSDHKAAFLVLDSPAVRDYYELELIAPNGQVMSPGVQVGGVTIHMKQRHSYTICKVNLPAAEETAEYLGDWLLRYTPKRDFTGADRKVLLTQAQHGHVVVPDIGHGFLPIGFAAAVASDYQMEVEAFSDDYHPGAKFTLMATLTDRGWPSVDGQVSVEITDPDSEQSVIVRLYDDGTHGDAEPSDGTWTSTFNRTGAAGVYHLLFRGQGRTHRGEMASREASRFISLSKYTVGPGIGGPDGRVQCIPCPLLWILIILFFLILILIYIRVSRLRQ